MRSKLLSVLAGAALAWNALAAQAAAQTKEITFWSHWAAEMPKRTFVEKVIADFEAKKTPTSKSRRPGTRKRPFTRR